MKKNLKFVAACLSVAVALQVVGTDVKAQLVEGAISDVPVAAKFLPKSIHARFMSIAANGGNLIAVGERGIIIRSTDKGATWKQMTSPVDITLASVAFETPQRVWAVGQAASILKSENGGATWKVVRYKPSDLRYYLKVIPRNGVIQIAASDGELWESRDAGSSWTMTSLENAEAFPHLFSLAYVGETGLLSGERGSVFLRSENDTAWKVLPTPYNGSFFGVTPFGDQFLLFGMSGKAYLVSTDGTKQQAIETQTTQFLLDAVVMPAKNQALLVGRGGIMVLIGNEGQVISRLQRPDNADITAVTVEGEDIYLTTMKGGISRLKVSSLMTSNNQEPKASAN